MQQIPQAVIGTVSDVLSGHFTHNQIDMRFPEFGFPGEPPVGTGGITISKAKKIHAWISRLNKTSSIAPFEILGTALEEFMEQEDSMYSNSEQLHQAQNRVNLILEKYGLSYQTGGIIRGSGLLNTPTKTLEQILHSHDLPNLEIEFKRANEQCENDPESAATAACAILEAFCKSYIKNHHELQMPAKQELIALWPIVRNHLKLDPSIYKGNERLKDMVQGIGTIIHAIARFRTIEGSAHGKEPGTYRLDPRHARLAVSASHTLISFLIETSDISDDQQT